MRCDGEEAAGLCRLYVAVSQDVASAKLLLGDSRPASGRLQYLYRSTPMHQISYRLQAGLTMRRIPVPSTSIASIGYLPTEHELEIKFRASGDVYRYFDLPGEEYAAFMAAESKGTYLNQVFKPREYRYVVVFEGRKSRV